MGRSTAEAIAGDVERVFFNAREAGDAITRYPGGDLEAGESLVGKLLPTAPRREDEGGDRNAEFAELLVPSDQAVTIGDSFLIGGKIWQLERIGSIELGMRELFLRRDLRLTTRPHSSRLR